MKLIVGLGNPGKEYAKTRHNVGFMVVDEMTKNWKEEKKFSVLVFRFSSNVLLVKSQTFMNDSGTTVKKIVDFYKVNTTTDLWVVHDDLDLELGRIKIDRGGSSGHHGIESIIKEIGTDKFVKFRVGIGRPKLDDEACYYKSTKDYLLSPFKKEELAIIQKAIKKTAEAIMMALDKGIDKTMNEFNS